MNYEIVLYEAKCVPLKNAVCKLIATENQTRNVVGIVFHSAEQVRILIEALRPYAVQQPIGGYDVAGG